MEAPSSERLRGKAGMVFVAGKTVWSMSERFKVVFTMQGAIQVLGLTFTFLQHDSHDAGPVSWKHVLERWEMGTGLCVKTA